MSKVYTSTVRYLSTVDTGMCRVYTSTEKYLSTVDTGMCRVYTSTERYLSTVDTQHTLFPTKRGDALDLIQTPPNLLSWISQSWKVP